jgi:N-acetylglutamate synthase-like GNAT family acetyltransferase
MAPPGMHDPDLSLRPAGPDDVRAIVDLVNRAYLVERFFVQGDRTDAAEVEDLMRRGRFLVAERAGALVACVHIETAGEIGRFGMLSVDPPGQGAGLGRLMVAAAERVCRDAGCREVEIEVVDLRTELFPFYRRLGYAEVGRAPFPEPQRAIRPCAFVVMRKRIDSA